MFILIIYCAYNKYIHTRPLSNVPFPSFVFNSFAFILFCKKVLRALSLTRIWAQLGFKILKQLRKWEFFTFCFVLVDKRVKMCIFFNLHVLISFVYIFLIIFTTLLYKWQLHLCDILYFMRCDEKIFFLKGNF